MYCKKYQVRLVWSKTKLLEFNSKVNELQSMVEQAIHMGKTFSHQPKPAMCVLSGLSGAMRQTLLPDSLPTGEQCMVCCLLA